MNKNLEKYQVRFNTRAQKWLNDFKKLDDGQLEIRPSAESWNMFLLYDHVMKVAYTYQLHNAQLALKSSDHKHKRNAFGWLLFDVDFLPRITLRLENFPKDLREKFTPELVSKSVLITMFEQFITDVNNAFEALHNHPKDGNIHHPMFGNINALEWLRLVEIHLKHHEPQRKRIFKAIDSGVLSV